MGIWWPEEQANPDTMCAPLTSPFSHTLPTVLAINQGHILVRITKEEHQGQGQFQGVAHLKSPHFCWEV